MSFAQFPYRQLVDALWDYRGSAVGTDLLEPWVADNSRKIRWLEDLGSRGAVPLLERPSWVNGSPLGISYEESHMLYALSRVLELLLLCRSPRVLDDWGDQPVPEVGAADYDGFVEALGLRPVERTTFHPFFHEIVEVEQDADPDRPAELLSCIWPACMLGDMMVLRAGVRVRAGRNVLDKEVAETSTLYWAWSRRHRPTRDESHGWGYNSNWTTSFRRDFLVGGVARYNIDGEGGPDATSPHGDDLALPLVVRRDLVRHRCLVRGPLRLPDAVEPYDLRWEEPLD